MSRLKLLTRANVRLAKAQCPAEVPVVPGQRFTCQTMIDGEATEITGVVLTPDGRYQVDRA
ncbi:hypothetical protein Ae406Ps2_6177c [Pseudonocardia sp. Ae406_Ps2]|uniref:DUF4333 domain-containing protein n=1 Tax=unclassified Pseudonocardia TaxID=2619320 RepID=UPI00094AA3DF|nr:hypothetical protein Ae406Ps2_6177c [Pseudonocardia sp. Ae406_Ps2]